MKRKLIFLIVLILFITGFAFVLYPVIGDLYYQYQDHQLIKEFQENNDTQKNKELYEAMNLYNQSIYENHQAGLTDAWSYQRNNFDFSITGFEKDMIGYISIEAMDIEIPLYVGASEENMAKGATVLSETSMPVGGENTNCVIAAHRGYGNGHPMFRNIELLKQGDQIEITNPWETLTYEVVKCIVISSDDIDAVKIVDGEDLVTLITCHPYTKNYQRYVVYCRRVDSHSTKDIEDHIPYEGMEYVSSQDDIKKEEMMQIMVIIIVTGIFIIILIVYIYQKFKKSHQ